MSVLAKCAQVLDVLERESRPVRLMDLAEELDVPKSSMHRMMSDLTELRFVRRTEAGGYLLGSRMLAYGVTAAATFDLAAAAAEPMRALCDEVGESVHLYVPEGYERVCLGGIDGKYSLRPAVRMGRLQPLGLGAAGRILYAFAAEDVAGEVQRRAAEAGRSLPDAAELAEIRREHWALSVGEREPGLAAGASSVLDPAGRVIGALSVGGSESRLSPERFADVRPRVHEAARPPRPRGRASDHGERVGPRPRLLVTGSSWPSRC